MPNRVDIRKLLAEEPETFLRQSMLEQLAVLHVISNDELIAGDAEVIHDFRVAIRTLRTRLKFFRPYFKKPAQIKYWSKELRWLDKHIQNARDVEVQIETLDFVATEKLESLVSKPSKYHQFRNHFVALRAELSEQSKTSRRNLDAALTSDRKQKLFDEFKTGLLRSEVKAKRILELESQLHAKLATQLSKINEKFDRPNFYQKNAQELHAVRLEFKSARYLAESIGIESRELADAQNLLGHINDLSALHDWLEKHLFSEGNDRKTVLALAMSTSRLLQIHRVELSEISLTSKPMSY